MTLNGSDTGVLNINGNEINVGDTYEISFIAQDNQELAAGVVFPLYDTTINIGKYSVQPTDILKSIATSADENTPTYPSIDGIVVFLESLTITISPLTSLGSSLSLQFTNTADPIQMATGSGDFSTAPAVSPLPVPPAIWLFVSGLALFSSRIIKNQ